VRLWKSCRDTLSLNHGAPRRELRHRPIVLPGVQRNRSKLVAAGNHRNHERGPRGHAEIRQVARASQPRRGRKTVELIGYALPSIALKAITSATSEGLEAALKVALRTLPPSPRANSQFLHRAIATASGAAGGTFGLAARPVELPVSTVIMLRSIADIARSKGEDHFRSGSRAVLRRGLRVGWACRIGRRIRERLFRRPQHARQDGDGALDKNRSLLLRRRRRRRARRRRRRPGATPTR